MDEKKKNKQSKNVAAMEDRTKSSQVDLDTIIEEELGQFGLYQLRTQLLLAVAVMFIAWGSTEYIFTTARIRTRCLIPECENTEGNPVFVPEWLSIAIPSQGDSFDNCQRFGNSSIASDNITNMCPAELFNQEELVSCEQYVYETTHTVVYEFDLACDEWRRSLIGSLRTVGMLLALPLTGFISDRWGRHTALAITAVNSAWLGSLRYFANTYVGFVVSQILEAIFGAGGYSCAYILIMETVGPKYRVAAGATLSTCFAISQVFVGLIAWSVPNWKHLTLILYIPQFLSLSFFWIIPESVRWYFGKKKYDEASATLKNIARINGKKLSEESLEALKSNAEKERMKQEMAKKQQKIEPWLVVQVFRHKPILLRCIVSPVWWIATTFIYYGLTINSVNISGNGYVNFIAVTAVEIPGFWIGVIIMNMVGRKPALIAAFWTCASCQFSYLFMSGDQYGASLAVYLVGKCAIAVVATTLYVYTTELYPTNYRHRLFAFSSMLGRIGAIIAPLTPAFGDDLPFILFGGFALVAGLLVLQTPETRGARFPDSMQEAATTGSRDDNI